MGDIADHLMANFMDRAEDWYEDIGSEKPLPKTCRYCGTKGLHWEMVNGKWKLHYENGSQHCCMGGVVVLPAGKFPVGMGKWRDRRSK